MPEYWFIIDSAHADLYEALRAVLKARPGFHVVKERRAERGSAPFPERRTATVWGSGGIQVAEHAATPRP
jgi:hypothetical protein